MFEKCEMKPMIVLQPGAMNAEHMKMLRDNGLVVVTAKNPHSLKFVDPIPSAVQRSKIEQAAIQLSRKLLANEVRSDNYGNISRKDYLEVYIHCLTTGTPLDRNPTKEEQADEVFEEAKYTELRKLAREEAKAEREAKKKAAATVKPIESK